MKKDSKHKEPKHLRKGKEFHKKIQKEWHDEAEGEIVLEKTIKKPSGRKGRIDVHVKIDDENVSVIEIKNSDWDAMSDSALRRNVKRQARQVWSYIESQIQQGLSTYPGIIFPKTPKSSERKKLIEKLFDEECIAVVWENEDIKEECGGPNS